MSIENPDFYPEEEARKEAAKLQEKIKSGEASSYNEAEKLVEKEKLENTIKELENLTKIEKLERQDIEPHLNKALELLQNEPETIRPKDKNNRPGGLVELKKDKPVLLIPDLHGKREMLFKILTEQNEDGKTNLERFLKNELQIVILGDAVHTEDSDRLTELKIAQNEYLQGNKQKALELLDKEIADSFGTTTMLMKLKELSPDNFHYLRGDHEVQKETYFDVGKRNVHQSSLVKFYFENKYGADFLDKYDKFEESLPLVALGNKFVASHAPHFKPFTKEEIINFHASLPPGIQKKSQFFKDLTVFRLGEDPDYNKNPSENVTKMLQALGGDEQWVYYFGHTYDDVGWDKTHHLCGLDGGWAPYFITAEIKTPEELIVRYHSSLAQVNPKRMWGGNVYDIEQHSPKKTTLIDMEKLSQKKGIKQENLQTPNKSRWDYIGETVAKINKEIKEEYSKLSVEEQEKRKLNLQNQQKQLEQELKDAQEQLKINAESNEVSDRLHSPKQDELESKIGKLRDDISSIRRKLELYQEYDTNKNLITEQILTRTSPENAPPQEQPPIKQQEQTENFSQQFKTLLANAEIAYKSKSLSHEERVELLQEYEQEIVKLCNVNKIENLGLYLPEVFKLPPEELNKLVANLEGKVKNISTNLNVPPNVKQAAEIITNQAAQKVEVTPNSAPEKSTKEKKKSFWENIGGLKGVGSAAGMSLFFFILLAIIGEIKLLDLSTGGQIEGGKKK